MEGIVEFSEWMKLDLRVGKILEVDSVEGADKLYKLSVDVGEECPRTLIAGLKPYFEKEQLQNKNCVVFTNLKPRVMMGIESHGMLLAASNSDKTKVILLQPAEDIEPGSRIS